MANISSVFQDALADQAKAALVSIVANNPKTTVKDLRELISDNPALGSLSLNELLGAGGGGGRGRGAPRKGKAAKAAAPRAGRKGAQKRNVRTEAGRAAFDQEVFEALKAQGGDNVSATSLREAIGAEPTQLRTSLNRLIESGLVSFTGKARGTRYSLI